MQTEITPKEIARDLTSETGKLVTPKRLRAFMRNGWRAGTASVQPVGQGNRYGISKADARAIKAAWKAAHASQAASGPSAAQRDADILADASDVS